MTRSVYGSVRSAVLAVQINSGSAGGISSGYRCSLRFPLRAFQLERRRTGFGTLSLKPLRFPSSAALPSAWVCIVNADWQQFDKVSEHGLSHRLRNDLSSNRRCQGIEPGAFYIQAVIQILSYSPKIVCPVNAVLALPSFYQLNTSNMSFTQWSCTLNSVASLSRSRRTLFSPSSRILHFQDTQLSNIANTSIIYQ